MEYKGTKFNDVLIHFAKVIANYAPKSCITTVTVNNTGGGEPTIELDIGKFDTSKNTRKWDSRNVGDIKVDGVNVNLTYFSEREIEEEK